MTTEEMAPGPISNGMAKGTISRSNLRPARPRGLSSPSAMAEKVAVKSSRAISRPRRKRMMPPAIRKAGREMPKKASSAKPEK